MRGFLRRLRRRTRSPRPVLLMYHRVAAPAVDPWGLAVHPDRFEAHLDVLRRRTVLSVSEIVRQLQSGTLPDDAVGITFDDGYVDNAIEAEPRLAARAMPATLFAAAGAIGQPREFWWDELARAILCRREAVDCVVQMAGREHRIAFGDTADDDPAWRVWHEPRTARQRTFVELWKCMRGADPGDRSKSMDQLRCTLGLQPAKPVDLPMSDAQLEQMSRSGTFTIGGHTLTHVMLPAIDAEQRRREIFEGKRRCEDIVRQPIEGFAYPHGAMDDDSRAAVRECGFKWACTTEARPLTANDDVFALPRFFVGDVPAEEFERTLA
jgi:peptidoglycan/xylan/chitin deacetylase (PgdA/CDA1 family)